MSAGSQLADRLSALEAEKALWQKTSTTTKPSPSTEKLASGKPTSATDTAGSADPTIAQLRLELAEALRSKGQLQGRLKAAQDELKTLRSGTQGSAKRINELTAERNALKAKLKDRNEELAGKNKMLKVNGLHSGDCHAGILCWS